LRALCAGFGRGGAAGPSEEDGRDEFWGGLVPSRGQRFDLFAQMSDLLAQAHHLLFQGLHVGLDFSWQRFAQCDGQFGQLR